MNHICISGPMYIDDSSGARKVGQSGEPQPLLSDQSDERLVALTARGCDSALELLYDRHSSAVFSLSLRIVRDQQVAEELTQEVFIRVWQRASSFRDDKGRVRSWMLRIARNLALDEIRRQQSRPLRVYYESPSEHLVPEVVDNSPGPNEIVLNRARREQILRMLVELPVSQREVIEMAYFGGMTQLEIADYKGEPLSTIKTRMRLGLQRLRSDLLARGIQPGTI